MNTGYYGISSHRISPRHLGLFTEASRFPALARDGDTADLLADNTNGLIWHLRYREKSSSTYRWEWIGGSPLFSSVDTAELYNSGTSQYQDLTTVGPSITLPLDGDYMISWGARAWYSTGGPGQGQLFTGVKIGSAATVDADATSDLTNVQQQFIKHSTRTMRKNALSASDGVLKLQYKSDAVGINLNWEKRWLSVQPARCRGFS